MAEHLKWVGLPSGPYRCFLTNGYALIVRKARNHKWHASVLGHGMPQEFDTHEEAQRAAGAYALLLVNTMLKTLTNDQH